MFDKYKARFAKFEEDHESVHKVIQHLRDNQQTYLVGAGCLSAGYLLRRPTVITVVNEAAAPVFNNTPIIAPVMNNIGNQQITNFGGPMTKMVKCLETGEIWEKVTEAADGAGVTLSKMSRHLNGKKDHVDGLHYKIVGLGTSE